MYKTAAILMMLATCAATALAGTIEVGAIGDEGWYSDDTRSNGNVNVVGLNYTHAAVPNPPGPAASAADDATIAQRFTFVPAPAGASNGAVNIAHPDGTSMKSTLSVIDTDTGLATGDWRSGFSVKWRKYHTGGTTRGASMKIGVQTTLWADSQNVANFSNGTGCKYSGEPSWDLVLVNNQVHTDDTWVTHEVDGSDNATVNGNLNTFKIYPQAGNGFFGSPQDLGFHTLEWWANTTEIAYGTSTWGDVLFGTGAKVTNFQFGAGSGPGEQNEFFDWVETSLVNGGDRVDFTPEPASMTLLALGGLGVLIRRRRAH